MLTVIEAMNRSTSAELIPLPIPPTDGDYALPNWDWTKLIWGKIEKRVANLQRRIYRAIKEGQFKLGLSLERLLNRSTCAILLGVRRVTQENKGKHAVGVDKFKANTPEKRKRMALRLMDEARRGWEGYKALPAKRRYIQKSNGKLRPLGVPTQFDRGAEYAAKLAMEPHFEALFESSSYGFRPAMGTHDAIDAIFKALCHKPKVILDADITGCFDNIDHEALLNLIPNLFKDLVKAWLERGGLVIISAMVREQVCNLFPNVLV